MARGWWCSRRGRPRAASRPATWNTTYSFTCSARSAWWPTTYTWWRADERRIAYRADIHPAARRFVHPDAERRAGDLELGVHFFAASARTEFVYSLRIRSGDRGLSVRRAVRLDSGIWNYLSSWY